ncbi:LysR family transcriptional regulator [Pseudomonas protegens]|uniref:LysR family transcriptional regulator n=1 Tax=Pseudomonas protegens TaxID=380021 RepID=UPI002160DC8C|nr:LysR family transcriptional regulator [Pseudomonas protegens]UVL74930.1 LysR family transcriptional regulator [Pseudomonas protegens]
MIETRLLRQFIAVAEELHFHKAATRLHMAQPPLSQAIARLEEKLGFSLLRRNRRGVALTPAGVDFLHSARRTLATLEQGIEQARHIAQGLAGSLRVSSLSLAGYPSLLASLRGFRQALPEVRLELRELPSAEQLKGLLGGDIDLAFMRELPLPEGQIASRLILDEPIVIALPHDHPQAQAPEVDLRELANDDFVFTPQALGSGYHNQLMALCSAAGFTPKVVQEVARVQTQLGLVGCGFGVALVPRSMADAVLQGSVAYRPLRAMGTQPGPSIGLYMNRHRDNPSPQLQRFMALLDAGFPKPEAAVQKAYAAATRR